ncbi:hypothetical protein O3M35_012099 [Rhynocoris fuscipes]|uniref:Uncharacterized protein n=1 Tax=Rhynocoris fuscipes TaxID=488301 RepID=A0AAW1CWY6_9HEMI
MNRQIIYFIRRQFTRFKRVDYCCFAWDLFSGLVVSMVIGFTVAFISLIVNIGLFKVLYGDLDSERYPNLTSSESIHYTTVFLFLILEIITFSMLFYAIVWESKLFFTIGWALLALLFLIWAIITGLSFKESHFQYLCVSSRCPESHWLLESGWRGLIAKLDCKENVDRRYPWGYFFEVSKPPLNVYYDEWFSYVTIDYNRSFRNYSNWPRTTYIQNPSYTTEKTKTTKANKQQKRYIRSINQIRSTPDNVRNDSNKTEEFFNKVEQFGRYVNETSKINFRNLEDYLMPGSEEERADLERENGERAEVHDILKYIPSLVFKYDLDPVLKAFGIILAVVWALFMIHTLVIMLLYSMERKRILQEQYSEDYSDFQRGQQV